MRTWAAAAARVGRDPLCGEWVIIAAQRQERTFLPPPEQCPLCPSTPGRPTEIPAGRYDVVVFENRFPSLSGAGLKDAAPHLATPPLGAAGPVRGGAAPGTAGTEPPEPDAEQQTPVGPFAKRPAHGRCEVVCFTADHTASFARLPPRRVRTVVEAWADRTAAVGSMPGVEQVYCFENRGEEESP